MKRTKIMSIAMAILISAAGFSASAQNNGKKRSHAKARKECVSAAADRKDACIAAEARCDVRNGKSERRCRADRFLEGITLTPEQQAKFDTMKQKQRAEFDKKQKERKEKQMKKAEKQRQKAEKQRAKNEKKMEKRMEKLDKEMKEILTPEQYSQYKQNVDKAKAERKNRNFYKGDKRKSGKYGKGHSKEHHHRSAARPGESASK